MPNIISFVAILQLLLHHAAVPVSCLRGVADQIAVLGGQPVQLQTASILQFVENLQQCILTEGESVDPAVVVVVLVGNYRWTLQLDFNLLFVSIFLLFLGCFLALVFR